MLLQVAIEPVAKGTALVRLTGPLTLGTSLKTFDAQLLDAIGKRGLSRLVIDMSEVPYIDSAGLGALIHAFGLSKEHGGSARLANVCERVMSLLKMTHTNTLLSVDDNVEASLAALAK